MFQQLNDMQWLSGFLAACGLLVLVIFLLVVSKKFQSALPAPRKLVLYAAFLLLGIAFLFGDPLAHWVANLAYGVQDAPDALNASSEAIAADAKAGGWVQVGEATSKIILAASFYVLTYLLPWLVQQVTHPAPTAWAKDDYTQDFASLPVEKKFENNRGLSLNQSIRIAASILGACLIH